MQAMSSTKADVYYKCFSDSAYSLDHIARKFKRRQVMAITDGDGAVALALQALRDDRGVPHAPLSLQHPQGCQWPDSRHEAHRLDDNIEDDCSGEEPAERQCDEVVSDMPARYLAAATRLSGV